MSASPNQAVFLSYASQDAEAARRICESLRAGGMEVWFDADGGLEHGDEWDAKIRRQIKECVFFIPILSANTQARLEGYFRIEWELAAERAMGIAAGVPFVLPIVIDGTREPDAFVPERFRKVQWTRIPEGNVPPEVQARVLKLWSHRTGVLAHEAARTGAPAVRPLTQHAFQVGRGLAAVVFTDVVGYSARMQRDETGTMALVKADFALMSERCTEHGGEVLNTMGDGLLMCFSSAVQAVACALQIQSEFGARRGTLPPEQTLEHRMGVHIGDVFRQESGGVAGDGVNIASRLEGKAPVGGVCISQMVYDTVKGKVAMQAVFVGPESFKNITEPIPIWHVAAEGGPTPSRAPFASGRKSAPVWKWPALAGAAVAVVAAGVWLATTRPAAPPPPPASSASPTPRKADAPPAAAAAPKPRGIAVLPFENLDTADQAYFAAGVTEEVTQQLSKIRALRVMSRNAVARFRGGAAELPAMTRELAIGAILTGTVRRAGDVVRIGVQLLAAPSGETLWSEQYDRPAKDIFAVQSDVAKSVVRALQASLAPAERARIERPPTENAGAYELYLKARSRPLAESVDLLKQAIALDPRFGLAYSELSHRYIFLAQRTGRDDLNRAVQIARQGVALDPQLARAHQALATALSTIGREDEARLAFQRAIELDSNFSAALNDLSVLETQAGRIDQAFSWAKRSFQLAPNLANSFYHVVVPLMLLDAPGAERWLQAGASRFPVDHPTLGYRLQVMLAVLELRRGQAAAALQRMRSAVAAVPRADECQAELTELAVFTGAPDARERVDRALKAGPDARSSYSGYTPRTMSAFLWLKAGDRERALPLIEAALAENRAAMDGGDRSQSPSYENAALDVMRGNRAAALESLERAYAVGNRDADFMKVDPLLAPLATEPRFIQLVDRMNRDLREMRARVDLSDLDELAKGGLR